MRFAITCARTLLLLFLLVIAPTGCGDEETVGPLPMLEVPTYPLAFTAIAMETAEPQMLVISNRGTGDLRFEIEVDEGTDLAGRIRFSHDMGWASPEVPDTVLVSIEGASVSEGRYEGGIRIVATAGGFGEAYVKVYLIVSPVYGGWNEVPTVPTTEYLLDVEFAGDGFACAVGKSGTILRTGDYGVNWVSIPSGVTTDLRSLDFAGDGYGWILSETGQVLHSADAGLTWELRATLREGAWQDVCFGDALTGWVVGRQEDPPEGFVYKTVDGGETWDEEFRDSDLIPLRACCWGTERVWVVAYYQTVLRSFDGGTNWFRSDLPALGPWAEVITFVDPDVGWVVGYSVLLRTTDGGISWTPISDIGFVSNVIFIDRECGWALAQNGVMHTTDAGAGWVAQVVGFRLRAIAFADRLRGCAVGVAGRIIYTSSGGI